jgi:hypothetical protein
MDPNPNQPRIGMSGAPYGPSIRPKSTRLPVVEHAPFRSDPRREKAPTPEDEGRPERSSG